MTKCNDCESEATLYYEGVWLCADHYMVAKESELNDIR